MRRVLVLLAAALAIAAAPRPASAFDCNSHCKTQSASCKTKCSGQEKGAKADAANDCQKKCDVQAKLCVPTCNIVQRNPNDPARAEREMRAYLNSSKDVPGNSSKHVHGAK